MIKRSKYGNKKCVCGDIRFDSVKEMQRFMFLKDAEERGEIANLSLQSKFELIPAIKETYVKQLKTKAKVCERTKQLPITYTADFSYYKDGVYVVEDVKASPHLAALDKAFLLKRKLFLWKFNFEIKCVYKFNDPI